MGDMPRWRKFAEEVLSGRYREDGNGREGQTAEPDVKLKKEMEEKNGKFTPN